MKRRASVFLAILLFAGACSTPASPQKKGAGKEPKQAVDGNKIPLSVFRLNDLLFPPPDTIIVSAVLGLSESQLIVIPQGYEATSAEMNYVFGPGTPEMEINGFIGQTPFTFSGSGGLIGWKAFESLQDQQSGIPVSVQGAVSDSVSGVAGISLSMKVLCVAVR